MCVCVALPLELFFRDFGFSVSSSSPCSCSKRFKFKKMPQTILSVTWVHIMYLVFYTGFDKKTKSLNFSQLLDVLLFRRSVEFTIKETNKVLALAGFTLMYVIFYWISHSHLFNKIDIQPTYMHKYSSSPSLVPHSLIYMLIQVISHTYVTLEPQRVFGDLNR